MTSPVNFVRYTHDTLIVLFMTYKIKSFADLANFVTR